MNRFWLTVFMKDGSYENFRYSADDIFHAIEQFQDDTLGVSISDIERITTWEMAQ